MLNLLFYSIHGKVVGLHIKSISTGSSSDGKICDYEVAEALRYKIQKNRRYCIMITSEN